MPVTPLHVADCSFYVKKRNNLGLIKISLAFHKSQFFRLNVWAAFQSQGRAFGLCAQTEIFEPYGSTASNRQWQALLSVGELAR